MLERIYTIPVNEAFEAGEKECSCPFCLLYKKLQNDEIELILGASMMEPDVRIKTNEQGFCARHYNMMLTKKNRLSFALILESHLNEIDSDMKGGVTDFIRSKGDKAVKRIDELNKTCYVCGRIEFNFSKMIETAVYLFDQDSDFRKKLQNQKMLCLPHFKRFVEVGKTRLHKKKYPDFYDMTFEVMNNYFSELRGDVSWFCKKFDYRYENEPWGNSKDAIERSIKFLCSDDE